MVRSAGGHQGNVRKNHSVCRVVTLRVVLKLIYTVICNYGNPWFLLNNSVNHWPILMIFGKQHYKET